MITTPTVLILGAGTSMNYGYPSGLGLKEKILRSLSSSSRIEIYQHAGFNTGEIREFSKSLNLSGRHSVDAFLEHRPDLINIGKFAIANCLINCEILDNLFINPNTNWLDYLFQRMNAPFSEFGHNKLSIITFNYDRTVETYLYNALLNSYKETPNNVAEVIKQIKIIHVHGILCPLEWQDQDGRPYAQSNKYIEIMKSAECIRIIHEQKQIEEAFTEASQIINTRERIVFLGFGYNQINLERLGLDYSGGGRNFFGSAFDLEGSEKGEVQKIFRPTHIYLGEKEEDTLLFLRRYISL